MRHAIRSISIVLAGAAVALSAGVPAAGQAQAAPSAGPPGWRVVDDFGGCGDAQVYAVSAERANDAWTTGQWLPNCSNSEVLIAHWNGQSWQEIKAPPGFGGAFDYGSAVAAVSGSYAWTFVVRANESFAVLRQDGRWRSFPLADRSVIDSAAAFSRSDAWAFGRVGNAAYALRFNGRSWRRAWIPVVPAASSSPGPANIWAVGVRANAVSQPAPPYALAHWTGRWQTHSLPGLPRGSSYSQPYVVAAGSTAFVAATVTNPADQSSHGVLLHWTGTRWVNVMLPVPTLFTGPLARDGNGGLWIASTPANLPPSCDDPCNNIDMLHYSAAGAWTQTTVHVSDLGVTDMKLIPGTTSLWATGSTSGNNDFLPVLLKYGP